MNETTLIRPEALADTGLSPSLTHVSRLYLDRDIPRDRRVDLGSCTSRYTEITDRGVERFIRDVVASEFPDGFSVTHGTGAGATP
jgi:hypothetical protein